LCTVSSYMIYFLDLKHKLLSCLTTPIKFFVVACNNNKSEAHFVFCRRKDNWWNYFTNTDNKCFRQNIWCVYWWRTIILHEIRSILDFDGTYHDSRLRKDKNFYGTNRLTRVTWFWLRLKKFISWYSGKLTPVDLAIIWYIDD